MEAIRKRIFESGMIAPISVKKPEEALKFCHALVKGGVFSAELVFMGEEREQVTLALKAALPELVLGVHADNAQAAEKAIAAGADFLLLSTMDPRAIQLCKEQGRPAIPTCANASELKAGIALGLDLFLFTGDTLEELGELAESGEGVEFLVDCKDVGDLPYWLSCHKVLACRTDCMLNKEILQAGDYTQLVQVVAQTVVRMHGFTFAHMCINPDNQTAEEIGDRLAGLFAFPRSENPGSYFVSDKIEITRAKGKGKGANGHLGIITVSVGRAMAYLRNMGVEFELSTLQKRGSRETFVFLKEEIGGFAVHIVQYL